MERTPSARVHVRQTPGTDWNEYVDASKSASLYHRHEWPRLVSDVFRQEAVFIEARAGDGALVGVLPLVVQRGFLQTFMTSLPYFNYGGALADTEIIAIRLMERARDLALERGCSYLELRDTTARAVDWTVRTEKVAMILDLPSGVEILSKALGSKLRSQVRRPDREGAEVSTNSRGDLEAFYDVFCRNMHSLGTPVYPFRFFKALVEKFPDNCTILVVRGPGGPQAAAFLSIDRDTAEIPWAACRGDAKPRGYNMKLYWECLRHAIENGCKHFDFGRSTLDSPTYKFKAQWGARPRELFWYRWEGRRDSRRPVGDGRLRTLATRTWSSLPLRIANVIGPFISPRLPW